MLEENNVAANVMAFYSSKLTNRNVYDESAISHRSGLVFRNHFEILQNPNLSLDPINQPTSRTKHPTHPVHKHLMNPCLKIHSAAPFPNLSPFLPAPT